MSDSHDKLRDLKIDRSEIDEVRPGGSLAVLLIVVVLAAVAAVAGWLVLRPDTAASVRVAPARTVAADAGAPVGATVLDASGYVVARRQATISSKVTGKIVEVLVEEGMEVEEDQVLARLDDSLQRRQLALAEARVDAARTARRETEARIEQAELDVDRSRRLVEAGVEHQASFDRAETDLRTLRAALDRQGEEVDVAEREVDLWRQQLDDTVIRAPFGGVAVSKNAQPGEMISPAAVGGFTRTGISTIVDMSSLEIEVDVNEAYIQRVAADQPVVAVLDAYPDWQVPARVITTIPTADRQKATVQVRIAFEETDPRILPEMGVKVSFLAAAAEERAAPGNRLVVPAEAVRRDGEQSIVFVVESGTARRRAVTAGGRLGPDVEILGGLGEGDRVIVSPPADLADGAKVVVGD